MNQSRSIEGLRALLTEVSSACSDRKPAPVTDIGADIRVEVDRERLYTALVHAVRNAQDATAADGHVALKLRADGDHAVIEVIDDGEGMDSAFVRDRLFKPFDSTKGAKGMGIGAYQIRETIESFGGNIEVTSAPCKGTSLRMTIPASHTESIGSKERAEQARVEVVQSGSGHH